MKYQLKTKNSQARTLLQLKSIYYKFENINILKNIHFELQSHTIHAIVGDHDSGKSSLAMIINGVHKPVSGEILFKNQSYHALNINQARKLKIETVFQNIYLLDYFTVAENLLITDKFNNDFPLINRKQLFNNAQVLLESYGFDLDPSRLVKDLQVTEKMVISILRSLYRQPDLLILDSSLEKLATPDLEKMIVILKTLKDQGMSILFLTNRIDEVYNFADKVTILRHGEILLTDAVDNMDRINLIKLCYSQISKQEYSGHLNQEFYQLLKYNEAILQKLPNNLIVTDTENRIKMVNEFGQQYFNVNQEDIRDLNIDEMFIDGNEELLGLLKQSLAEKKEKAFYDLSLQLKQGRATVNIKIQPIYDGKFLIGNIIIIEDVSKQESLRQQVILSEKLASVGLLAAGVAHEINNPLEIIYNYLSFLKFNLKESKLLNTVKDLEEEITYIKQIVSNLISFSDNNKTIVNENFDIDDLIKSIISLIKFNVKNKKIKIDFKNCRNGHIVFANKNEMKQVLLNLIKNSIEAMPDGGRIEISTCDYEEKFIQISIKDNGTGIQDENPGNIFLPFYSTKKRGSNNLGLGLSITYGIIKKYNGEIEVANVEPTGCEFKITLPKEQE